MADKITLEFLIEQAMKIPGVKVDRAEYLSATFADQGILVPQIVEEGPVASDYSEIELDNLAEKLILRRTSESSAMSFAAGIPGGLAIAATIPADTLQFFAMSLRMAQELAYLYGARDFWSCEGEDGALVRYQLICSLGAMFEIEGAMAATRLLSSHLAMRAVGGTPQRATTRAFWDPIVRKIGKDLTLRLTTDTASKGVAKLIPVIGGFFSGGMRFFSMRPMGQRLSRALSTSAFLYDDSFAMKDYLVLENFCERAEAEQMNEAFSDTPAGDTASENESWGSINPAVPNAPATNKPAENKPADNKPAAEADTSIPVNVTGEDTSVPIHFGGEDTAVPVGGQKPAENTAKPAEEATPAAEKPAEAPAEVKPVEAAAEAKPAEATPAAMTMDEVFNTIERLAALRDKGAITQEDFDRKKEELLARI
ncbi:MAG: SHOCT domain-containing protein [Lachnospiraceae bacterium]|nr:SHOCT domain-containing protein [Lachnospiraceae bacterium]